MNKIHIIDMRKISIRALKFHGNIHFVYLVIQSFLETADPETEKLEGAEEKAAEAATEKTPADAAAPEENVAPKKSLFSNIRLPALSSLSNIIPKRLRSSSRPTDDVEMGNGPNNKAGLASMETLDDSTKDNEGNKDETDKATINEDDMETVKLNDTDKDKENDKAAEAAAEAAANGDKRSYFQRLREYQLTMDDFAISGGVVVFLLLVAIICTFIFYGGPALKAAPLRDGKFVDAVTSCGNVEGVLEDSAFAFRGIPYAIPPIGANRWRPAQVINDIDYCWNGTLKAHNSTPVCWQSFADGAVDGSENCLHLDVITPHVRYEGKLPVVVLIGAESLSGGSPTILRPSARTSRARDVIFVRPNFRLGVFGFLALNSLSRSTHPPVSGNYALSDIIAALQWIQLNIIHFGGNPHEVTLLGHRAGGTLVAALAASPATKGLFARAWVASGAASFPGKPLADSERANNDFLNTTICKDAECLRSMEDEDVLDAVPDSWKRSVTKLPDNSASAHEWLVLDGQILQKHPIDVWKSESGPARLVIGTTAHESHSAKLFEEQKEWTPEIVRKYIQDSKLGELGLTDEILKRYNATYQGLVSIISDIRTICPLLTINKQQPAIPFYVVTQTGGEQNIADVDADVQAILGRYEPKTPEQRRYVSAIQQLFYHYVSHGDIKQRIFNVGQDALQVDDYPNCSFWISKDIVPRYARLD